MSLQFADVNADGHQDILTAVWEGTVYVVPGSAKGFGKPEYVKDRNGELIRLSRYYDMKKHEYVTLDAKKPEHLISTMAWDIDADGDLDLVIGAKDGGVYLRRNEGTAKQAAYAATHEPLMAAGAPFVVPGGSTAPKAVDWDADGKTDLVCGSFKGYVYWFRNVGENGAPVFEAPVALVKPEKRYAGMTAPEQGLYVDPVDTDGDGDLDLVVGGFYMDHPPARTLTDEERERLAKINEEMKALGKKMSVLFAELREATKDLSGVEAREARSEFFKREDYRALSTKSRNLSQERTRLQPRPTRQSGVWFYERTTARDL